MNSKERIIAALNGYEMDRTPIIEIGIWPETEERWRKEGLPVDMTPHQVLGLDELNLFTFDGSLGLKEFDIEENEDYRIFSDKDGCTYKAWKKKQGAPLLIDSQIKTVKDWDGLKNGLLPDIERFFGIKNELVFGRPLINSQQKSYELCKKNDVFTVLVPTESTWYFLRLLGEEEALMTMAADPDFAHTIIKEYTDFNIGMIEKISSSGYEFDAMWVFSDLCYKNGMLFSPDFFRKYILHHQRRLFDCAKNYGMKIIYHSDGNVNSLLPLLIEAGIDCIQPLEARAGNDICEYVDTYGKKISYIGNINADVLASDKNQIYSEIKKKVNYAKSTKKYLFHSDHSVPPTVSWDNYRYAIDIAKEFGNYQ